MPRREPYAEYHTWRWESLKCRAFTKAEARAMFKAMEGIDRLPVGANIIRVNTHQGPMPR